MTTEDTPEKRNLREGLKTLGDWFVGAAMDRVLDGTFNPVFSALVTLLSALVALAVAVLVLLKTGILQIASWPTSAFIVLGIVAIFLLGAAVALTLVWAVVKGGRLALNLLFRALQIPPLKRTLFERITDPVIFVLLFPIVTVLGWIGNLVGWIDEQRNKPTSPTDGKQA